MARSAKYVIAAEGGVVQKFLDEATASGRTMRRSQCFLDRAATPPPAEEGSRLLRLSRRNHTLDSCEPGALARTS